MGVGVLRLPTLLGRIRVFDTLALPHLPSVLVAKATSVDALKKAFSEWRRLVKNRDILKVVRKGYSLSFAERPKLSRVPIQFDPPRDPGRYEVLSEEVRAMLQKEVITEVTDGSPGFYSRIFTVPKKNGTYRPVIDLSPLNRTLKRIKFKMETAKSIRLSIRPGDWATSLDLRDAYFHVSMHPETWKYLRFVWEGRVFQFVSLPFGLSPAPYIFTMVTKQLAILGRKRGLRVKMYLDDWLTLNHDRARCHQDTEALVLLTQQLGFNIQPEKSDFVPSTSFSYLGMTFDTLAFTVQPNGDRLQSLSTLLSHMRQSHSTTYRTLLSLLGKMESMATLLPLARVYKRPLQRDVSARVVVRTDFNQPVVLGAWFLAATQQWTDQVWLHSSVPIRPPGQTVYLHTDASTAGWGGHTDTSTVSGVWTAEESRFHINLLELEAVARVMRKLVTVLRGQHVTVCGDNVTCLAYLRNQGGTVSLPLSLKAEQFLLWAHCQEITISTEFVPGKLNVLADMLSRRNQILPTEWTIAHQALEPVWRLYGKPMVDLFATRYNARLPLYVSPMIDPEALGRDAFARSWRGLEVYAYPPTKLVPKVLAKFALELPRMILVTPFWPAAPWFPDLLALAQGQYMHLGLTSRTLLQPRTGVGHTSPQILNLTAWHLSPEA